MAASIPIPRAPYHISLVLFTLQIWWQPASLFPELTISASSSLLCRHDGSQHPYSLSSLPYQPRPVYSADMTAASIPIPWAYHISFVLFTLQTWRQPASLFPELLTISASSCLLCRHDGSHHPYSLSSLPCQPRPVYSADMTAASIPIPWAPYHISLVLFILQTWQQPASLFPELLTMSASSCLLCRHDGSQHPYSLSSLPCQPRPVYSADMTAASIPIPWAPHPIVLFTLQTWWQPASLFPELLTISALSCLLCRHDRSQHPYSLSLPYQPRPVYSADMTAASTPPASLSCSPRTSYWSLPPLPLHCGCLQDRRIQRINSLAPGRCNCTFQLVFSNLHQGKISRAFSKKIALTICRISLSRKDTYRQVSNISHTLVGN